MIVIFVIVRWSSPAKVDRSLAKRRPMRLTLTSMSKPRGCLGDEESHATWIDGSGLDGVAMPWAG